MLSFAVDSVFKNIKYLAGISSTDIRSKPFICRLPEAVLYLAKLREGGLDRQCAVARAACDSQALAPLGGELPCSWGQGCAGTCRLWSSRRTRQGHLLDVVMD